MDLSEGSDLFDDGLRLGEPSSLGEEEGDVGDRLAARQPGFLGLDPHTVTCSRVSLENKYQDEERDYTQSWPS